MWAWPQKKSKQYVFKKTAEPFFLGYFHVFGEADPDYVSLAGSSNNHILKKIFSSVLEENMKKRDFMQNSPLAAPVFKHRLQI